MFNKFKDEYEDSCHWKTLPVTGKDIETVHKEICELID